MSTTSHPSPAPPPEGLHELLNSVRVLARYAVETGQLPASVNIEELYLIRKKITDNENITDHEFGVLVNCYQTLERRLGPVSVETLEATERIASADGTYAPSEAEHYVSRLWKRTYINIAIILVFHLMHALVKVHASVELERMLQLSPKGALDASSFFRELLAFVGVTTTYLIPFLYGALGADAYLLRETSHLLHSRQFDARRIPENHARFLLGALSGGVIVLFISEGLTGEGMADDVFTPMIAAPGFVAGYSNDLLFNLLERIIGAILPRGGRAEPGANGDLRAEDAMLQHYRRRMDATTNPDEKEFLKTVVEDLESRAQSGR